MIAVMLHLWEAAVEAKKAGKLLVWEQGRQSELEFDEEVITASGTETKKARNMAAVLHDILVQGNGMRSTFIQSREQDVAVVQFAECLANGKVPMDNDIFEAIDFAPIDPPEGLFPPKPAA
jgi:hypothetical protein